MKNFQNRFDDYCIFFIDIFLDLDFQMAIKGWCGIFYKAFGIGFQQIQKFMKQKKKLMMKIKILSKLQKKNMGISYNDKW